MFMKYCVTFHLKREYQRVPWKLSPAFSKIGLVSESIIFIIDSYMRAIPPWQTFPGLQTPEVGFCSSNLQKKT